MGERGSRLVKTLWVAMAAFVLSASMAVVIARAIVSDGEPRIGLRVDSSASLTAEQRAERLSPGKPWDGVGRGAMTQAQVESFEDFPLMWSGATVLGFNLQEIQRAAYEPPADVGRGGENSVRFLYGVCTEPGMRERTCPDPVQILVEPACDVPPEQIDDAAIAPESRNLETVRGAAQLLRFADGHVRLWTGSISIYVSAPGQPDLVNQIVESLKGLGAEAAQYSQAELPAPDLSKCEGS